MRYPFFVEQAWAVLHHLATDFLRWPDRYQTEADIQAEFHRRLVNAFEATGVDTYQASWSDGEKRCEYIFSRIGCQHGVRANDTKMVMFPDIVIYDDLDDPEVWPEDNCQWPVAMAIEIKHRARTVEDHYDVEKLARLVENQNARYGCWINVERSADTRKHGVYYHSLSTRYGLGRGQLWTAQLVVPEAT